MVKFCGNSYPQNVLWSILLFHEIQIFFGTPMSTFELHDDFTSQERSWKSMKNLNIEINPLKTCRLNGTASKDLWNTFKKFISLQLLIWNFSPSQWELSIKACKPFQVWKHFGSKRHAQTQKCSIQYHRQLIKASKDVSRLKDSQIVCHGILKERKAVVKAQSNHELQQANKQTLDDEQSGVFEQ